MYVMDGEQDDVGLPKGGRQRLLTVQRAATRASLSSTAGPARRLRRLLIGVG
jgi:hypothetical protein